MGLLLVSQSRKRVKPMWTEELSLVLQGTVCKPLGMLTFELYD